MGPVRPVWWITCKPIGWTPSRQAVPLPASGPDATAPVFESMSCGWLTTVSIAVPTFGNTLVQRLALPLPALKPFQAGRSANDWRLVPPVPSAA